MLGNEIQSIGWMVAVLVAVNVLSYPISAEEPAVTQGALRVLDKD